MRAAVIGAGPAGSEAAARLARGGVETVLFDPDLDREKPCGGGVPWRGLAEFDGLRAADLPAREVRHVLFEAPSGATASVTLPSPLRVFSRRTLDSRWVARAEQAGARVRAEKVVGVVRDGEMRVRTASGRDEGFDLVVGADGVTSRTRAALSRRFDEADLSQAVGYYVPGGTDDVARLAFTTGLNGYLWSFPRTDHLAVGACAPLAEGSAAALWREVDAYVGRIDPSLDVATLPRYGALIPALSPASLRDNRIAGPGWLLVGDAAGSVDPLTREGIAPGLRSAALAADVVLAGHPERYPRAWEQELQPELLWASERSGRFFAPDLTERLVRYLDRSKTIRAVMADLVLGRQSYRTLKRRLLRAGIPFLLESALRTARPRWTPRARASTPSPPK